MQKLSYKQEKINIKGQTNFNLEKYNENISLQESLERHAKC